MKRFILRMLGVKSPSEEFRRASADAIHHMREAWIKAETSDRPC